MTSEKKTVPDVTAAVVNGNNRHACVGLLSVNARNNTNATDFRVMRYESLTYCLHGISAVKAFSRREAYKSTNERVKVRCTTYLPSTLRKRRKNGKNNVYRPKNKFRTKDL
ncbi:hypothetical protein FHG87_001790 [Trinorchestia longiramus]|nr:hypothetical protein FHG87_001790 [Trinorchestia longiramus]